MRKWPIVVSVAVVVVLVVAAAAFAGVGRFASVDGDEGAQLVSPGRAVSQGTGAAPQPAATTGGPDVQVFDGARVPEESFAETADGPSASVDGLEALERTVVDRLPGRLRLLSASRDPAPGGAPREEMVFADAVGGLVTVWWQWIDPQASPQLIEPGDETSVWPDGAEMLLRRRPSFVQVMFFGDGGLIGSVTWEKPVGDAGASPAATADEVLGAARNVYEAIRR